MVAEISFVLTQPSVQAAAGFAIVGCVAAATRDFVDDAAWPGVFRSFHLYELGDFGTRGGRDVDKFANLLLQSGGEGGLWQHQALWCLRIVSRSADDDVSSASHPQ